MKRIICIFMGVFAIALCIMMQVGGTEQQNKSYIKYAEFNVTKSALKKAVELDIKSADEKNHISAITLLSYLGAKYGGNFDNYKSSDIEKIYEELLSGKDIKALTKNMKYFNYYTQVYTAALNGVVGTYKEENENSNGKAEKKYGVKWFSPIAKTFPYSCYDDFGAVRTYGYTRPHLGHDLMAAVGTPVIAVESGKVECLGWNQYGGWRIGIRSNDKKRYWYYAHLRQNRPYAENLKQGDNVTAGDVIGYVGRTGYSSNENVNNITQTHLHLGLELVFDEKQKESENEIWINLNAITDLVYTHQSSVLRNNKTKEFTRQYQFIE